MRSVSQRVVISRGKMRLPSNRSIFTKLRSAVQICEPEIQGKHQGLTVALDASEHIVVGDIARLQQVVWNLLKNASKFTPESGEILHKLS